jgi:TonB family protein
MSIPTELGKTWEGRLIDGKYPLQKWIGGSDHSAVFVTGANGMPAQRLAIKLIDTANLDVNVQLSCWADAAKLSNPLLLRSFAYGRGEVDNTSLLYFVAEFAEENLAEVIPLRALSESEAVDLLRPAAEALADLHQAGFVHGHIKPANIMAVGTQLKLSADGICKKGEHVPTGETGAYDAPEIQVTGATPASDIWSLGMTLLAVLTQSETKEKISGIPGSITQPLHGIIQQCLQLDPARRCSARDILEQLSGGRRFERQTSRDAVIAPASPVKEHTAAPRVRKTFATPWVIVAAAILTFALLFWIGHSIGGHDKNGAASEAQPASSSASADPNTGTPASTTQMPSQNGVTRGTVLQQVMPDVSRGALHTIRGQLKVGIEVQVDGSGNVSYAKMVSAGPSRYFATRSLEAARRWRFNPPQINGQAVPSDWVLRFQFARTSAQVAPTEIKP